MDLHEKRKSEQSEELNQGYLHQKYLSERKKRFDNADVHLFIQKQQNDTDMLFISDKLMEFKGKLKEGSPNDNVFQDMILALLRVNSYCSVIESTSRASVAEYIQERKNNEALNSTIRKKDIELLQRIKENEALSKEIENLKKQIDFGT